MSLFRDSEILFLAYQGKVYDVSQSFLWQRGVHQVAHWAGCNLTEELKAAPHGADLMDGLPIVGELVEDKE